MIKVYDRAVKDFYIEDEYGKESLNTLYNTIYGRIFLKLFFSNRLYSKLFAIGEKSRLSKKKIKPFIKKYNINMEEYEEDGYKSFDEFFTRKKKEEYLEVNKEEKTLIAPCDGKIQMFKIDAAIKSRKSGKEVKIGE